MQEAVEQDDCWLRAPASLLWWLCLMLFSRPWRAAAGGGQCSQTTIGELQRDEEIKKSEVERLRMILKNSHARHKQFRDSGVITRGSISTNSYTWRFSSQTIATHAGCTTVYFIQLCIDLFWKNAIMKHVRAPYKHFRFTLSEKQPRRWAVVRLPLGTNLSRVSVWTSHP